MKLCKNSVWKRLCSATLVAGVVAMMAGGCTTKDETLGANLIPDNQQMKTGYFTLPGVQELNPKKYVETRLYRTDSIVSSNLSNVYFGAMYNDTLGLRTAGFLSQYSTYYLVDTNYFGYRPIFDSAQILLAIESFGRDTLTDLKFEVYEVIDNRYLTEKPIRNGKTERDSTFYIGFDPESVDFLNGDRIVGDRPLFTFSIGASNQSGPASQAITMTPTDEGREFVKRLMLQTGKYKDDYSIYESENATKWFDEFKGLYIKPVTDPATLQTSSTKGTIYASQLSTTGFSIYGRNRRKDDPSLIKDTVGLVCYFTDTNLPDNAGNMSINSFRHDYAAATSPARLDPAQMNEPAEGQPDQREEVSLVYIEGMGGAVAEMTFAPAFFEALEERITKEKVESGKEFHTLAFTQVLMEIFFPGGQYDWRDVDPLQAGPLIERMNIAPSRLGMYSNYKSSTGIADYLYTYESYYGTTLAYGGYINRSHGCYLMDITASVQQMWNEYLKAKEESEDGTVDYTQLKYRTVYIGPDANDLFTTAYTVLQGGDYAGNQSPIRFELAYNLIKKYDSGK